MTDKSEDVEKTEVGLEEQLADAKAQADKRTQRENEEFRKYACSSIVGDLLTVVDDLDRALEHAGDETEFVKGIRGVRTNMMKVLEANGLKEIPAEGRFDPDYHEALCTVDGDEDGLIAEVFHSTERY